MRHFWKKSNNVQQPLRQGILICDPCQALFSDETNFNKLMRFEPIVYERQIIDFWNAALSCCQLCLAVSKCLAISEWYKQFKIPSGYRTTPMKQSILIRAKDWAAGSARVRFRIVIMRDKEKEHLIKLFRWFPVHHDLMCSFEFYTHQGKIFGDIAWHFLTFVDDPAAPYVPNRMYNHLVTSGSTFDKIRTWLSDCDLAHDECGSLSLQQFAGIKPSYLLGVQASKDSSVVWLVNTSYLPDRVQYAALSYVWGGSQPYSTTKANLHDYIYSRQGINLADLGRTIQDAVKVTRKLGMAYLWVDALCIVQNSKTSLHHELGKMAAIYHNAAVVISANTALSAREGFLHDRAPPAPSFSIAAPANGRLKLMQAWYDDQQYIQDRGVIVSRAWTFQEFFMARRIILFDSHQVFWECRNHWGSDGGRVTRESYCGYWPNISCRGQYIPSGPFPLSEDWEKIISAYSEKELSYSSDKFAALSAIANYWAIVKGDTYLAGLWKGHFRKLLMWQAYPTCGRPKVWRAPSWSFLSLDGKVFFPDCDSITLDRKATFYDVDVLSYEITLVSTNAPFGAITHAQVTVCGTLIEFRVSDTGLQCIDHCVLADGWAFELNYDDSSESREYMGPSIQTNDDTRRLGGPIFCCLIESWNFLEIIGLYTGAAIQAPRYYIFGLALVALDLRKYHRIGTIKGHGPEALKWVSDMRTRGPPPPSTFTMI